MADLSRHVPFKLKTLMNECRYFSIALDESTDVTDISQPLIFARIVDEDFGVHEELLTIHPLKGGTKGSDIYAASDSVVSECEGFKKCSQQMPQRPWWETKLVLLDC